MKRVVVTGPGRISVEEVEAPGAAGPGEVSLQLHTVGICGGDIALLADDRHPSFAEGPEARRRWAPERALRSAGSTSWVDVAPAGASSATLRARTDG